jgi:peptidoglycan L-alanyl-D-glutamate endopeptidase CwlK
MRDKTSLDRAVLLHPAVRQEVVDTIQAVEATWPATAAVRIVQGFRSIEEQDALYAQGRTKPGAIVTKAKGGKSYHNYGLAIDFALLYDKDGNGSFESLSWDTTDPRWAEVVKAFENKGWFWGGKFSTITDKPHLEKSFGHKVGDLFKKYRLHEWAIL